MSYSTQDDILEQLPASELIGLSDDPGIGEINAGVVSRAIEDADAQIDSYCQGRYTLPLSPAPAMIRRISVDLAIYELFSRRSLPLAAIRKERQEAAIRFLEQVAMGRISLGTSSPAPLASPNQVSFSGSERLFSRETLKGL